MKCIKISLIQKYIDGEASSKEIVSIKNHLANCKICATKINHRKSLALGIKRAINNKTFDVKVLPTFKGIDQSFKRKTISRKEILYMLSAACVIGIAIFIFKKPRPEHKASIIYTIGNEIDANKPVSKQQMIIQVIDEKGTINEYNAQ